MGTDTFPFIQNDGNIIQQMTQHARNSYKHVKHECTLPTTQFQHTCKHNIEILPTYGKMSCNEHMNSMPNIQNPCNISKSTSKYHVRSGKDHATPYTNHVNIIKRSCKHHKHIINTSSQNDLSSGNWGDGVGGWVGGWGGGAGNNG